MKSFLAASATALLLVVTASADWVIEAKIESPQMNSGTVTKIKGDKMRTDIASGPLGAMSVIIDGASGDSTNLIHSQKMAMKTTAAQMKQMAEMAKKFSGASDSATTVKPVATGQKEKIDGYDCEIWTWTDGKVSAKYWISPATHPAVAAIKDLDAKMRNSPLGASHAGPAMSEFPGAALKTEYANPTGNITMTITSVKEENVDAKEFEAPADYQSAGLPAAPGAIPAPKIPAPK